jgi:hypothetical protein
LRPAEGFAGQEYFSANPLSLPIRLGDVAGGDARRGPADRSSGMKKMGGNATRAWVLALTSLASFMVSLDSQVVATALSTIRLDLGASIEQLEWTVNAHVLAFAVLLMTGAALGDRCGRRRMFIGLVAAILAAAVLPVRASHAAEPGEPSAALLTGIPAEQQIQLAMSAAPPEIARHATILVLGPTGYVTARTGTNGYTCLVERQYVETLEPSCYDAEGSVTTLLARTYREELRAAKVPEEEIEPRIDDRYKAGFFKAPGKAGLVYMLSPHNKVYNDRTKKVVRAPPHLMFYAPYATQKDIGEFVGPHMPYVVLEGRPDAYIIVNRH